MPALRAAAAGPRALGGDGQKTRAVARDLFDAAARHRTGLVHAPFYGVRCVTLQTSAPTRSIHANCGRATSKGEDQKKPSSSRPPGTPMTKRQRLLRRRPGGFCCKVRFL